MLSSQGSRASESFVADPKTVAEAHTSTGRHLRVSLRCAAPPATSRLYYDFPEEGGNDNVYLNVVGSHGDLLLLEIGRRNGIFNRAEHFVYSPAGIARPPSLSPLPVRDIQTKSESAPTDSTVLLRRGEKNDVLVVQVHIWCDFHAPRHQRRLMAEFCVLRPGMRQWEVMEPVPILHDLGAKGDELILESPRFAVSVGDRFLCWVHYNTGFVLCDFADEASPKARYVPFPAEMSCRDNDGCNGEDDDDGSCSDEEDGSGSDDDGIDHDEHTSPCYIGAAAGDTNAIRLVSIDRHGVAGFTINKWTLNLGTDDEPLAWVKDGEINCEELWKLPGYEGLPRPTHENLTNTLLWLDLDNPDVVGLLVCNKYMSSDEKVWMVQLNMKTKTLLSAVQLFTNDPFRALFHLPVQLQCTDPESTGRPVKVAS
jgi:hypothetical protein